MQAALSDGRPVRELEDEVLAQRAASDFEAFSELYSRYLCRIYGFLRSQAPDEQTAEDLTAHTFFRALSGAGTFTGAGSYRSWLFRIAHNALRSWRAGHTNAPVLVEDLPEPIDPAPSPPSVVVAREDRNVVWRLVSSLPPAQREVLALRYLEDLSTEEIAQISGRSRGAVRILLHRARNSLRRVLGERGIG